MDNAEIKQINGQMYYFLKDGNNWSVYVWIEPFKKMHKLRDGITSLYNAKEFATNYAQRYTSNDYIQDRL